VGRIYLSGGEVVHAEVIPSSGAAGKEGPEAFNEALSWRGGTVVEEPGAEAPQITIQGTWQSLILNACQRMDESCDPNSVQLG